MLGHADLESQAIAYQSLVLRPQPKLRLFELGKSLKAMARGESGTRKEGGPGVPLKALSRLSTS